MSALMHEVLPIVFMFGVAALLGPLVGITMWIAFDGDRLRVDVEAEATAPEQVREPRGVNPAPRTPREATTAA